MRMMSLDELEQMLAGAIERTTAQELYTDETIDELMRVKRQQGATVRLLQRVQRELKLVARAA